jgi:Ca-activated chloride channel family protein
MKEFKMKNHQNIKSHKLAILIALVCSVFINTALSDGFIVIPPPHPRPMPGWRSFPLEVKYHNVDVDINETSAATSIDQEFYNPTGQRLDGFYIFPIPEGASISKFSMFINGKETEAEMLDAKKARAIYEDIVRRNIDPALLEYYQQGIFKVRIFPIEPYSTKRIKISYREILQDDNGTTEYHYPLNTEKFSAKNVKDVSIKVTVSSQAPIRNVYCPTHEVDMVRQGSHQSIISYEEHDVKPDKDFILFFRTDRSKIGMSLITQSEPDESKGFFLLDISPDIDIKPQDIEEKDITFALDVSGSMAGDKLKQAKKALLFCIDNLNKGDRFDIIRFSTEAEALFGDVLPSSEMNKSKAVQFIQNLKAIGGTNIEDALRYVMKQKIASGRPNVVLFITDGKPTINETNEDKLVDLISNKKETPVKIFTFGIGDDINTHLLDKITTTTNAYRTYITPKEDIEIKISNLYTKIQSPVMANLKITTEPGIHFTQIYPKELPDLFKGSSITVLGRFEGFGRKNITLEGTLKGKTVRYNCDYDFSVKETKNDFIPPLWAARKVGYLLDQLRLNGESKEVIDELVDLSKKYGIVTPYTSYLIVEDEEKQVASHRIMRDELTLGNIAPQSSVNYDAIKKSYSAIQEKSGSESVIISKEFQALNDQKNISQGYAGRMNFVDSKGNKQELTQQVRNILGRAMYQNGMSWIDPAIQKKKYSQNVQIKYGSDDYFKLLNEKPLTAKFFSLGKNVKFVYEETLYEVSE